MKRLMRVGALVAVLVLLAAACGSDGGNGGSAEPADERTGAHEGDEADDVTQADEQDDDGMAADGSGRLEFDGETIMFERSLCWLEEQDAAGGGGSILLTGQGFGTDAEGQPVSLDFTRFGEDSQFAGDSISVDIGDPRGDSLSYSASLETGAVSLQGSTLRASDLTLTDDDGDEHVTASFTLEC